MSSLNYIFCFTSQLIENNYINYSLHVILIKFHIHTCENKLNRDTSTAYTHYTRYECLNRTHIHNSITININYYYVYAMLNACMMLVHCAPPHILSLCVYVCSIIVNGFLSMLCSCSDKWFSAAKIKDDEENNFQHDF